MAYSFELENGVLVPMAEIWIEGKEIPESYYKLIEEVIYESYASGSDLATIYLQDPNLYIIDDKRLTRGMRIDIFGGWSTDLDNWLSGYISLVDINFPEKGNPTIIMHCMDESFLLNIFKVKRTYNNITFSEICDVIARIYGLKTEGKATETRYNSVSQADETDIKFLVRLAEKEELILKIVDGTIKWWPKYEFGKAQTTLVWRKPPFSLKSFNPKIMVSDKEPIIEEGDINVENKEIEEGEMTPEMGREQLGEEGFLFDAWEYDSNSDTFRYIGR